MANEIGLDKIMLTAAAASAWHEIADRVAVALVQFAKMGKVISEIPDEQARVNDDGTLTIFIEIPDVIDISMNVPADHWAHRL